MSKTLFILNDIVKEYRFRLYRHMCKDINALVRLSDLSKFDEIVDKYHEKGLNEVPFYYEKELEEIISKDKVNYSYLFLSSESSFEFNLWLIFVSIVKLMELIRIVQRLFKLTSI